MEVLCLVAHLQIRNSACFAVLQLPQEGTQLLVVGVLSQHSLPNGSLQGSQPLLRIATQLIHAHGIVAFPLCHLRQPG